MPIQRRRGQLAPSFIIAALTIIVLCTTAVILMLRGINISPPTTVPHTGTITPDTIAPPIQTKAPDTPNTSAPSAQTTAPPPDTASSPSTTTEITEPIIFLPEADPVSEDYFTTCTFLGDSRTQGFVIATGGYGARYYADRGLSISDLSKKKLFSETADDGSTVARTAVESLTINPTTGNIYIWLGLNELGWNSSDIFRRAYRNEIALLQEACPDAQICIMSILPVARNAVVVGPPTAAAANEKIRTYNSLLQSLAEEMGVYYLNCYEAFVDDEGYLPDGIASDGIHLLRDSNTALVNYLLTHPIPQKTS